MTQTILLTGAAGRIGAALRPMLRSRYNHVVLSDQHEIADLAENESFRGGALHDVDAMSRVCEGVHGIIHMGGQPTENAWEVVDASNIQGMMATMTAAHAAGVERFVFASSSHVVGMYPRTRKIGAGDKVRPDTRYGLSKAFGEALCALFADRHGMRCLSIRIGNVSETPADLRRLSIWLHPEDLFQLVTIGLEHPDLHNEIVFGCSDNARGFWDNKTAFDLGYRPKYRSEDHANAALAAQAKMPADPIGDRLQGGSFTTPEFDGDIERTLRS